MQDDEACKNCKMRKAINYIATEAASDICNNLSEKRSWEFVEEYVDNMEVLLSKGLINIAFRDVFVNIYVYGAESTVDRKCLVSGWILSTPFPFYNCS